MTVPATTRRAGPFNGNGATTAFPFTFKVFSQDDIQVVLADANGVEAAQTLTTHYTVALNPDQDASPGGTVTMLTAPATGETLTVTGALDYEQTLDLPAGGNFSPLAVENAFDRTVIQIQQLLEKLSRALTVPVSAGGVDTELPAPEGDALIGWDAAGTALINRTVADLASVVAYATWRTETFSGDGTTADFALLSDPGNSSNCDVSISGVTQVAGIDYTVSGSTLAFSAPPPLGTDNIAVRYGSALPLGEVEAGNVSYLPSFTGAEERQLDARLEDIVSAKDFGAVGDGVADDYTSLQTALDYVAATGKTLYIPAGTYALKTAGLSVADLDGFRVTGAGMYQTMLVRAAEAPGTVLNILRCDRVVVDNIGFDGGFAEFPGGNANQGFVFNNCNDVLALHLYATNFKNGGVNCFADDVAPVYRNVVSGCDVDGLGVANNGINLANVIDGGIERSRARGCPGSPGYGLQLKNNCSRSFIRDSTVESCDAGVAFGNDSGGVNPGVQNCLVANIIIYDCREAVALGAASNNLFEALHIDMNDQPGNAFDLQTGDNDNNVFRGVHIRNVNTSRSAIRIRLGNNNLFDIAAFKNPAINSSILATLDPGVTNNRINLDRMISAGWQPWSRLVTNNSGNTTNTWYIDNRDRIVLQELVGNTATLVVGGARILRLDTEGLAATDNLDSITGGQDGQVVTIQSSNNARDITLRDYTVSGGNIQLASAAPMTLGRVEDSIALVYKDNLGRWCELYRVTL